MNIIELLLVAIGLSMDAFAVSICKGLAMKRCPLSKATICGFWFGGFQALMPLLGYLLGYNFRSYITNIDHWIAFVLLGILGINMVRGALSPEGEDEDEVDDALDTKTMFLMAIATSIDALAVGITFAFLPDTNITMAIVLIGLVTFVLSTLGAKLGSLIGGTLKKKAELMGGVILIILGIKILIEHLT